MEKIQTQTHVPLHPYPLLLLVLSFFGQQSFPGLSGRRRGEASSWINPWVFPIKPGRWVEKKGREERNGEIPPSECFNQVKSFRSLLFKVHPGGHLWSKFHRLAEAVEKLIKESTTAFWSGQFGRCHLTPKWNPGSGWWGFILRFTCWITPSTFEVSHYPLCCFCRCTRPFNSSGFPTDFIVIVLLSMCDRGVKPS